MERHLLSTDQEMIPARNAVDARVSNFVLSDEFATIRPEGICTVHPLTARYLKCLMFSVCLEQSVVATNSKPGVTRAAPDTPPPPTPPGGV